MNISENREAQIDRFLFGQMATDEAKAFEKEMASDTTLQTQVEQIRREHRAMELMLEDDLSTNMNQWKSEKNALGDQPEEQEAKIVAMPQRRSFVYRLSLAASVLIVVGIGSRFWAGNNYSNDALAEKHFQETLLSERSGNNSFPEYLNSPIKKMNAGDNTGALSELQSLAAENKDLQIQSLIGEAQFKLGNYEESVRVFKQIAEAPTASSNVRKEAEMNLLLSYLKSNQMNEFDTLKSKILEEGDLVRTKKIQELEGDLNGFWRMISGVK